MGGEQARIWERVAEKRSIYVCVCVRAPRMMGRYRVRGLRGGLKEESVASLGASLRASPQIIAVRRSARFPCGILIIINGPLLDGISGAPEVSGRG